MNEQIKDGGPAFPHMAKAHYQGMGRVVTEHITENGMSLRDYFAAAALQGFVRSWSESAMIPDDDLRHKLFPSFTRAAYEVADAMLTERERK